ncbi:MAG TPA: hypothetical protein DIW24_05580 [Bacteroidetes bacterium]|nr:hypothetical protein [Bacteroidota bacterium]HRR09790.1 hypothetical protein [Rhodothermales bacterium]
MDVNLHQKKGIEHLAKVLRYYPMVQEGQQAVVGLTREDWHVLCDTLFHMNTPREAIPVEVLSWRFSENGEQMVLETQQGVTVLVEMF